MHAESGVESDHFRPPFPHLTGSSARVTLGLLAVV
jgi:hypothetical protein